VGSYYIVLYDDVDAPLQLTMKIIMGWLLGSWLESKHHS
jgi:hypothetical protein